MSVDSRNARYEWDEDGSMEVHTKGTGAVIDLDKLMAEPDEDADEVKPV